MHVYCIAFCLLPRYCNLYIEVLFIIFMESREKCVFSCDLIAKNSYFLILVTRNFVKKLWGVLLKQKYRINPSLKMKIFLEVGGNSACSQN